MAETAKESECYVGVKSCGCCVAATVINPAWSKETAKDVADMIRRGLTIEKKPTSWARQNMRSCKCGAEQIPGVGGAR